MGVYSLFLFCNVIIFIFSTYSSIQLLSASLLLDERYVLRLIRQEWTTVCGLVHSAGCKFVSI